MIFISKFLKVSMINIKYLIHKDLDKETDYQMISFGVRLSILKKN